MSFWWIVWLLSGAIPAILGCLYDAKNGNFGKMWHNVAIVVLCAIAGPFGAASVVFAFWEMYRNTNNNECGD